MAKDIGEQAMQELLRALSRDGVKNSAKMNYGLNLLARYRAREFGGALYGKGGPLVRTGAVPRHDTAELCFGRECRAETARLLRAGTP